jgi:hypothetical protein
MDRQWKLILIASGAAVCVGCLVWLLLAPPLALQWVIGVLAVGFGLLWLLAAWKGSGGIRRWSLGLAALHIALAIVAFNVAYYITFG